jgi:hypothetical protein
LDCRRARDILKPIKGDFSEGEFQHLDQRVHNQIIQELLADEHEAGMTCEYYRYYNRFPVNATEETPEDEAPDGWLDLDACEMRLGHKGGSCILADDCIPFYNKRIAPSRKVEAISSRSR